MQGAIGAEDADGHGQVEAGALFLDVGGREVDGDVRRRHVEAGVLDGGAHAVAAFAHGGVGQADGVKVIFLGLCRRVDFDVDDVRVDAVDSSAEGFEEHGRRAAQRVYQKTEFRICDRANRSWRSRDKGNLEAANGL